MDSELNANGEMNRNPNQIKQNPLANCSSAYSFVFLFPMQVKIDKK